MILCLLRQAFGDVANAIATAVFAQVELCDPLRQARCGQEQREVAFNRGQQRRRVRQMPRQQDTVLREPPFAGRQFLRAQQQGLCPVWVRLGDGQAGVHKRR